MTPPLWKLVACLLVVAIFVEGAVSRRLDEQDNFKDERSRQAGGTAHRGTSERKLLNSNGAGLVPTGTTQGRAVSRTLVGGSAIQAVKQTVTMHNTSSVQGHTGRKDPMLPMGVANSMAVGSHMQTSIANISAFFGISNGDNGRLNNRSGWNPPDQALCVGNNRVFTAVNNVYAVNDQTTAAGLRVGSLMDIFVIGQLQLGDPRCLYDPATKNFIVVSFDRTENNLGLRIAASATPELPSSWWTYVIANPLGGNVLPDYPTLGMNAEAVFITVNQFDQGTNGGFVGGSMFAMRRKEVVGRKASISVSYWSQPTYLENGAPQQHFTMQPAVVQGGTKLSDTMFFAMSSFKSNHVIVAAVLGTKRWARRRGRLHLVHAVVNITTEHFPPPSMTQPNSAVNGVLNPGGFRFIGAAYAAGRIWAAGATHAGTTTGLDVTTAGVVYYVLEPIVAAGSLRASVITEGIVYNPDFNVAFPAIGVSPEGVGALVHAMVGPKQNPSIGLVALNASGVTGQMHVIGAGQERATPVRAAAGEVTRYGDYYVAVYDHVSRRVWFAGELPVLTSATTSDWTCVFGSISFNTGP